MPVKKKSDWYKTHQSRQRSPWFHLVDRSFTVRLFIAGFLALLLLAVVNRVEKRAERQLLCQVLNFSGCLYQEVLSLITVNNVEAFGIVTASLLYVIERSNRKQQECIEAWQVIDDAANSGAIVSHVRIQALQRLNEAEISLNGINLQGANLLGIDLADAELNSANLSETILTNANLKAADLSETNLSNAVLTEAILIEANLTNADLTNADLTNADLTRAILSGTNLTGTILDKT